MRNERHTQLWIVVVSALLMSVALPVTVLMSRAERDTPVARRGVDLAASIPAASMAVSAIPQDIDLPTSSYDDATQSVSMVLVGSLLIGIGSVIRKGV